MEVSPWLKLTIDNQLPYFVCCVCCMGDDDDDDDAGCFETCCRKRKNYAQHT